MTIDDFAAQEIECIRRFVTHYKAKNAEDPESYPLDHDYEWHEQYEMHELSN